MFKVENFKNVPPVIYSFFTQLSTILKNVGCRLLYIFFCAEFENFLLCERISINVTTCQNETSS
jgi:hypothetical protein